MKGDATDEDLIGACQRAGLNSFLDLLPEGLETAIGEAGRALSGGERQRLSIARALLTDARLIILDEPTSDVDAESEVALVETIEALRRDAGVLVIAHRLSTVRNADHIFVLERGQLIEHGRHEELVSSQGIYAGLWGVQTGARKVLES